VAETPVSFASGDVELVGTLRLPDGLEGAELRPAFIVMHGFGSTSGAGNVLQPCSILEKLGYITLRYDQRGCGRSGGMRGHLIMLEQVKDAQSAISFLAPQSHVDGARIAMLGSSFGAALSIYTAGIDERVAAVVSASGFGHGARKFRAQHRTPQEWEAFTKMLEEGKRHRERTGEPLMVPRYSIVPIPPELRTHVLEGSIHSFTSDTAQSIYDFNPEDVIGRIAPRPVLFVTTDDDRLVPPEESVEMYTRAGEPKKLVVLRGYGHYEVYAEPAFSEVMQAALAWYRQHLPAR